MQALPEVYRAVLPAHRDGLAADQPRAPGRTRRADQGAGGTGEGQRRSHARRPLLLLRPDTGTWWIAPLADFGLEAWRKDGFVYTRSDPADPEFTLAVGGRGGPEEVLPVGTEIWLDDNAPTSGHRTSGWRRIIADIASGDWYQADPDAVDTTVTDR
ncbi:hypothetical protein [Streptomyces sp. NPDC004533]|uniref:hypothetical protein n=1 Tax=Streptomyces sp. NPDC004533 TaxID=3154278 RepID=UPI0033A829BE